VFFHGPRALLVILSNRIEKVIKLCCQESKDGNWRTRIVKAKKPVEK
jgi:hypothetical protein